MWISFLLYEVQQLLFQWFIHLFSLCLWGRLSGLEANYYLVARDAELDPPQVTIYFPSPILVNM